jgi:hypothetical protein
MGGSTYDLTIAAIRKCLAAGLRLRVVLVLDPTNVTLLPESIAELAAIGARELVVNVNWAADWSSEPVRSQCQAAYERSADLYLAAYRQCESVLAVTLRRQDRQPHQGRLLAW